MDFETEEQQVEALKKWWKENGMQVVVGVVLGVSAIAGWRYFNHYQLQQSRSASDIFSQVEADKKSPEKISQLIARLDTDFSSTPYPEVARLDAAKVAYENGKTEEAAKNLKWIVDHAGQEEIALIARSRLARILIEQGKNDEAVVLLDISYPESYTAIFEELKGDAWVASGNTDKARTAYDKALLFVSSNAKVFLQMKRDDLGTNEVASTL